MESVLEAIRTRSSHRTYSGRPIEKNKIDALTAFLNSNTVGPFGSTLKFRLIDLADMEREEIKHLGTYGVIKGASLFIVGTVSKGMKAGEDYGFCMEKNILAATRLNLGTCWLGGTFNKSGFAKKFNVAAGEFLPAISPVGYPGSKRSFTDNLFRLIAASKKRKPWQELFYDGDIDTPLGENDTGQYAAVLESVRIGPSASNKQPWRLMRNRGENVFHFYLERTKGYEKVSKDIRLQNIDMGIAMCHFQLSANEIGLTGRWEEKRPDIETGQWEYIVSWREAPVEHAAGRMTGGILS